MSVSTLAHRSAIAPEAQRDRAETSRGENPRHGPRIPTASRRTELMSAGFTGYHLWCMKYEASGVVSGAWCA
jgi:hypothetical protein